MNSPRKQANVIRGRMAVSAGLLFFTLGIAITVSHARKAATSAGRQFLNTAQSNQGSTQATGEGQLQARRENFKSGRKLLLEKGVPFEPEELLRDGWPKKLKDVLNAMPEMHEVRRERAPLKGAYIADTLYLPEKVELTGDTIILTNNLVFEGNNPVIKGSHALNVYPIQPTVVLGATLAQVLSKKHGVMNARFTGQLTLPRFLLIQDSIEIKRHYITFDTSGPEPRIATSSPLKSNVYLRAISWNELTPVLFQSQDTSGDTGITGTHGLAGQSGASGANQSKAPSGTCPSSPNGQSGLPGEDGGPAGNGEAGGQGGPGGDAGPINAYIADGDTNYYVFKAKGGSGGLGGPGGAGGAGGSGGRGGSGGDGAVCGCQVGDGGDAAYGGSAGNGGNGGDGGTGGTGGNGASITISLPGNSPGADAFNSGGPGGQNGSGGVGGSPGIAGSAGNPGVGGASACGQTGSSGTQRTAGSQGTPGQPGSPGAFGVSGTAGPTAQINRRGGGGGDNCGFNNDGEYIMNDGSGQPCTPIIIDVDGNGYSLTDSSEGVNFDLNSDGIKERLSWTSAASTNAFLVLDRNSNDLIDNGRELFGNYTLLDDGAKALNGWIALAEFDKLEHGGNADGVIDKQDAIYSYLRLWQDKKHNGISEPQESHSLESFGVDVIHLDYHWEGRRDRYGNKFRYRALIEGHDPVSGKPYRRFAYDVFLVPEK